MRRRAVKRTPRRALGRRARGLGRVEMIDAPGGARSCRVLAGARSSGTVAIADVRQCVTACGHAEFSPAAARLLESRPAAVAYADGAGGAVFVVSESAGRSARRTYSVKRYVPAGTGGSCRVDVEAVAIATPEDAHRVARAAARRSPSRRA